jgi:hypothetical protein
MEDPMWLLESVLATLPLGQPFQRVLRDVLLLLLVVPGRATFRNLSRYSDYDEKTFSRWFRRELDWAGLNVAAIRAGVAAEHESILAFDPSFAPKSGKHTAGLGRFWNGSAGRAEVGLELNVLGWVDVTANTAYAIRAALTPPEPPSAGSKTARAATAAAPAADAPPNTEVAPAQAQAQADKAQVDAEESRVEAYLAHLQQVIPNHGLSVLRYLTADGDFSKAKFVAGIKALGLDLISKLRRDADLRYRYPGPYAGRGRPRRYDGKLDWHQRHRFTPVALPDPDLILETAGLDAPRLRRCLRVGVVTHRHTPGRPSCSVPIRLSIRCDSTAITSPACRASSSSATATRLPA